MIRPGCSVLGYSAAKLTHCEDEDVVHAIAEVGVERCQRLTEVVDYLCQLSLTRSLIHMRVPSAAVGKPDLPTQIHLDELSQPSH